MIDPKDFYNMLTEHDITFFTGVPDSLLKELCAYITDVSLSGSHVIAANEGNAVGIAAGHYLASGNPAMVYMQNSGLGNAVNPLTSLSDEQVYGIPMLLVIGWRGEPGVPDEPQHAKMGSITPALLETLGIPYTVLSKNYEIDIQAAVTYMQTSSGPYALVVKKGMFDTYKPKSTAESVSDLVREAALRTLLEVIEQDAALVTTTGKTSREIFELRVAKKTGHDHDFLTVGSMGHASSIALGIALEKPEQRIYCLDGDGALLMHAGALATVGKYAPENFVHVVLNNLSYESVGGQPTAADIADIKQMALANRYTLAVSVETHDELKEAMTKIRSTKGPVLLEICINQEVRADLGRPTRTPAENKADFMAFLAKN